MQQHGWTRIKFEMVTFQPLSRMANLIQIIINDQVIDLDVRWPSAHHQGSPYETSTNLRSVERWQYYVGTFYVSIDSVVSVHVGSKHLTISLVTSMDSPEDKNSAPERIIPFVLQIIVKDLSLIQDAKIG